MMIHKLHCLLLFVLTSSCLAAETVTINSDGSTEPEECLDLHDSCPSWKASGECLQNPVYMHLNCQKSCGLCGCEDDDDRCPHLAYHNKCTGKDEAYMFIKCKRSCQACGFVTHDELEPLKIHRRRLAAVGGDATLLETKYGVTQTTTVPSDATVTTQQLLDIVQETEEYMEHVVFVDPKHTNVKTKCFNHKPSCAYWKATGACDTTQAFMRKTCAPTCQVCIELDFEYWCPIDDTKPMALPNPGDLDNMFERVLSTPDFAQYSPKAISMPNPPSNSSIPQGPWMIELEHFLTDKECDNLVQLGADIGYEQSVDTGVAKVDGTREALQSNWRTSSTAWCDAHCYSKSRSVHDRIEAVTGIPIAHAENLQLLKYNVGEYYHYHHDATPFHWERQQGPRVATLFIYLNTVSQGGGTAFPDINITVTPTRGKAVLWPNVLNEDPMKMDRRTAHQALPVEEGLKYGANVWIHQRDWKEVYARKCV